MEVAKFSERQIAVLLKQVDDGVSVEEVCRKAGISQQTCYLYGRLSRCKQNWL
jgi:putative transposase